LRARRKAGRLGTILPPTPATLASSAGRSGIRDCFAWATSSGEHEKEDLRERTTRSSKRSARRDRVVIAAANEALASIQKKNMLIQFFRGSTVGRAIEPCGPN